MSVRDFLSGKIVLHAGDCLDVLRTQSDASIDSVVTDPPYALVSIARRFGKDGAAPVKVPEGGTGAYARASAGFMGKAWDTGERAFAVEFWQEVFRVLKPGGHVLAFAGTRTYHRLTCAIEDAGFEIRDQIGWAYGSGFPKSHDVAKALTKRTDRGTLRKIKVWLAEQFEQSGKSKAQIDRECGFTATDYLRLEPTSDAGGRQTWHLLLPYGVKWARLKDVLGFDNRFDAEIERLAIVAARRAAAAATGELYGSFAGEVAEYDLTEEARQWKGWGTALKPAWEPICVARKPLIGTVAENVLQHGTGALNLDACRVEGTGNKTFDRIAGNRSREQYRTGTTGTGRPTNLGRHPANIVHDGSDEVVAAFPEASGQQRGVGPQHGAKASVNVFGDYGARDQYDPRGDAGSAARFFYSAKADRDDRLGSKHPTVKPVDLMQWLVRLVTPPGGTVLDPFAGTGTTGEAAFREGFKAVLIEREDEYLADIDRRMGLVLAGPDERRRAILKQRGQVEAAGGMFATLDAETRLEAAE